jgi:hypothetical protein
VSKRPLQPWLLRLACSAPKLDNQITSECSSYVFPLRPLFDSPKLYSALTATEGGRYRALADACLRQTTVFVVPAFELLPPSSQQQRDPAAASSRLVLQEEEASTSLYPLVSTTEHELTAAMEHAQPSVPWICIDSCLYCWQIINFFIGPSNGVLLDELFPVTCRYQCSEDLWIGQTHATVSQAFALKHRALTENNRRIWEFRRK